MPSTDTQLMFNESIQNNYKIFWMNGVRREELLQIKYIKLISAALNQSNHQKI